jgi:A/G-specific adenine glycosylase
VNQSIDSFSSRLIRWQRQHGRHDLPWQKTRDAYRIWLSEIMLQQTQVTTVIPYYLRFLDRYPDVAALAATPIEKVLESWSGLGYYARARNLHRCAQMIVADHGGQFPGAPGLLAELPGIGRSTAAAICVFACGTRAAILDGNVKRVLARCFGIEGFPGAGKIEKGMWELAESLLPDTGVEAYTQGLMDLGATVCSRRNPSCVDCPMRDICVASRDGRQAELPCARPVKALPEREIPVVLLTDGRSVLLERRPPTGIWGGLLATPEVKPESVEAFVSAQACRLLQTRELPSLRHAFSHFRLTMRPLLCQVERTGGSTGEPGLEWVAIGDIDSAALPSPVRRLLQELA